MRKQLIVAMYLVGIELLLGLSVARAQDPTVSSTSGTQAQTKETHHKLPLFHDMIPEEYRKYMPLPYGVSFNYVHQVWSLRIAEPVLNIPGNPLPPGFVRGGTLKAVTNTEVARVDAWILPFLNVYGTAARFTGNAKDINMDLAAPAPLPIPPKVDYSGSNFGAGFTAAFGYRAFFASYDINWNWGKPDVTNRVRVQTQGPRVGAVVTPWGVRSKLYVGGIRQEIAGRESGSVVLGQGLALSFDVLTKPRKAWSPLAGVSIEVTKHFMLGAEGSSGGTSQMLLSTGYRF